VNDELSPSRQTAHDIEILWAGTRFRESLAQGHYCIIGMPGSGKTVALNGLMNSVLPSCRPGTDKRAVIFDPKGDIMGLLPRLCGSDGETDKHFDERHIYLLNPFDQRGYAWDIAKDIVSHADCYAAAELFIPTRSVSSDANQYFVLGARAIAKAVLRVLVDRAPGRWNLRHLVGILTDARNMDWVLRSAPSERAVVATYLDQDPRTVGSLVSTVGNYFDEFSVVAALWDNPGQTRKRFSIQDNYLSDSCILVMGYPTKNESAVRSINSLFFYRLRQTIGDEAESRKDRFWFFIDELPRVGDLRGLDGLLAEGRSKGARIVVGFQDLQMLKAGWRNKDAAASVQNLCLNLSVLRLNDPETAEWVSKRLGKVDLTEYKHSRTVSYGKNGGSSSSVATERTLRDSILTGQLMNELEMSERGIVHGVHIVPAKKMVLMGSYARYRLYDTVVEDTFHRRRSEDERFAPLVDGELEELLCFDGAILPRAPADRGTTTKGETDGTGEDVRSSVRTPFDLRGYGRIN
jgi:GTPase SAR1 family protein